MNPAYVLAEAAQENPSRPLLCCGQRAVSYGEAADMAARIAGGLRQQGLEAGDRVALLVENSIEWALLYYACAWGGYVAAPLDVNLHPRELAEMVKDLEPAAVVMGAGASEEARRAVVEAAGDVLIVSEGGDLTLAALQAAEPLGEPHRGSEEDVSAILYTSGTTGRPRGAMLPYRAWDTFPIALEDLYEPPEGVGWMISAPMSHISGALYCNAALHFRGYVVILPCFKPSDFLDAVQRWRPWVTSITPSALTLLLHAARDREIDLSCFGLLASFGAPAPPELIRRFEERFNVRLQTGYGLTEVAPLVALTPPWLGLSRPYCVGQITRTAQVRIVDEEGRELPAGEMGEIIVSGPMVMRGYWRNPEATREVLKDGWFYTGDLGKLDEDGLLYIVGRKKDMIIVAGLNVYAAEVEDVLIRHPAVAQVAVIGVPDKLRGEAVKAVVVLQEGAEADAVELAEFARQYLAPYKVPRVFEFRDSLPMTRTGKINKAELREKPLYEQWVEVGDE